MSAKLPVLNTHVNYGRLIFVIVLNVDMVQFTDQYLFTIVGIILF